MDALVVENLKKMYDKNNGIKDVNVRVKKGTIHALLGNNGSGKSTTMKCVMGILFPDSGKIEVLGKELVRNDPNVKANIGYCPELPAFPKNLTGKECMEAYGYMKGISKSDLKSGVPDLLERVDLLNVSGRKVSSYSRGMLQRLDLAVAMLGNPGLLILDEPTSGLDPSSAAHFRELIRNLVSGGQTILLSDHRLSEVEKVCSELTIINKGQTLLSSSVSDLLNRPRTIFRYLGKFSSLKDNVIHEIEDIPGVLRIEKTEGVDSTLLIETKDGVQFKSELYRWASANEVVIYSLEEIRESLEDIFLSMVQGSDVKKD